MEYEEMCAKMEWEYVRVAAAFKVDVLLHASSFWEDGRTHYICKGFAGGVFINWVLEYGSGYLESVNIGSSLECYVGRWANNKWRCRPHAVFSEQMVKGLFCLGFDDESAFAELNYSLTAHEKLELKLTLPREFWPQEWLGE